MFEDLHIEPTEPEDYPRTFIYSHDVKRGISISWHTWFYSGSYDRIYQPHVSSHTIPE